MHSWDDYPIGYRAAEVQRIVAATDAGESLSVVGLSGAGKSNLLGFVAHRVGAAAHAMVLADANRLREQSPDALFRLLRRALGGEGGAEDEWEALAETVEARLAAGGRLTLLLDRLDALVPPPGAAVLNPLRALRDAFKYQLTFVTATRRPLPAESEFSELVLANTLWLGPLSEGDARWNVARYAARKGLAWGEEETTCLLRVSGRYPSFLRAASEALAAGGAPEALAEHPIVQARVAEFWADKPTIAHLVAAGLFDNPLLRTRPAQAEAYAEATLEPAGDDADLTAKEHQLYEFLRQRPNQVCDKEELIHAVWQEDQIYEDGVRDDSLAQLVRRLRQKLITRPTGTIETVRGRGYIWREGP